MSGHVLARIQAIQQELEQLKKALTAKRARGQFGNVVSEAQILRLTSGSPTWHYAMSSLALSQLLCAGYATAGR